MSLNDNITRAAGQTDKRIVAAPGTREAWTLEELLASKANVKVFFVETEKSIYIANSLNDAMNLWAGWRCDAFCPDRSPVLYIRQLG